MPIRNRLVTDPVAEMVLFHATFVALKARCPLTVNINPDDYKLSGEERLFQGWLPYLLLHA
jgi:hypothetical protein